MSSNNVYKFKQQAIFEAWLQDGVFYKQNDSYYVSSQMEVENRINELIDSRNYSLVKHVADQLKSPIALSDKTVLKSFRVPFTKYAELVELALRQKISLSAIVRNMVVEDLRKFIVGATKRKNVKPQRFNLFRKVFETWEKEPLKTEQSPKDYYSPSMIYYPHMPKELIKLILEKAIRQIKKKCSAIPPKVLEEYFKVDWEKNINELYDYYADCFEKKIALNQEGKLVLDIEFSGFLSLNMNLEEYESLNSEVKKQYGNDALQTLKNVLDVDEEWADEIGVLPIYYRLNLLSIPFGIKHGVLSIDNIVIKDEHSDEDIKLRYKKNYDEQSTILRSRLDKALKQEDWNLVSALSENLAQFEKDYQLVQYCLEIALKLFHKKHVISFRAPEIVVRAWEAYGGGRLELLKLEA